MKSGIPTKLKAVLKTWSGRKDGGAETANTKKKVLPCPPGLDPMVLKAYHNLAVSPLCRIPDEIILQIMGYLDGLDIACLRRACRIFLRIFQDRQFQDHHRMGQGPWLGQTHMTRQQVQDLRERILRDKYCGPCYEVRMGEIDGTGVTGANDLAMYRKKLYCRECVDTHAAALFSADERAVNKAMRRVCIAHEGHLRVCQHRVITWADVRRWTEVLGPETRVHRVILCRSPSHLSQCGKRTGDRPGGDGIAVRFKLLDCGKTQAEIQWDVHVSVRHTNSSTSRYDAADVRSVAERLHRDAGRYIVPRFQPGEPPHMAAFDPNFCGCLDYAGRGLLDWQMALPGQNCHASRMFRVNGSISSLSILRTPLGIRRAESESHVARYRLKQNGARHRRFRIGFSRCCTGPGPSTSGVVVTHRHWFLLSRETPELSASGAPPPNLAPPEWYRVMDPTSYGLVGDSESHHLLWCPDEKCANHISRAIGVDRFREAVPLST